MAPYAHAADRRSLYSAVGSVTELPDVAAGADAFFAVGLRTFGLADAIASFRAAFFRSI